MLAAMNRSLNDLQSRLQADGLDGATVAEHAGLPILAHLGDDAESLPRWLDAVERYARRGATREGSSLWSATRFVVAPLLGVAPRAPDTFARLLAATGELLVAAKDTGGRLEQNAIGEAARALANR